MTETVSADADPVSADADLVSADGGTVSADGADAGSASANAGHHSGLKPERPPGSEPRGYLDPFDRGDRAGVRSLDSLNCGGCPT
jgi:hypothetical protein